MEPMKAFREFEASDLDASQLKSEMAANGYVLIRGLLPKPDLQPLLTSITKIICRAGWLNTETDPLARVANPDAACCEDDDSYKDTYDRIFSLLEFHRLPHHPVLREIMKALVGEYLFIHPKSAGRLIFPNFVRGIIHAHQDHQAVAGDVESFTAWMPLHDCPVEHGPLRVLEGSHRFGLQATVGRTGYIEPGAERGAHWVGGPIYAGDLLLFHSLTVHEAMPNRSDRLRISLDCRFQSYDRPVNPGTLVFAGSGRRSWEKTYAGWRSDELKYYWTRLPLELKPSAAELAQLAETAEPVEMRQRYARILARLEEQMPALAAVR